MNQETSTSKVTGFIEKNVKVIFGIAIVLVIFLCVALGASAVSSKTAEKGLSELDQIEYTFKKDVDDLSDADFEARQDAALKSLEELSSKCGITGVRANMLKADILFQKKDYSGSRDAWEKAAKSKKSAYTASICYYNAAVCSENLNDLDKAVEFYELSLKSKDFLLADHAYFSLGRVYETKGNTDKAKEAYNKVNEIHPDSRWAAVAKSRAIAIEASEPKAE